MDATQVEVPGTKFQSEDLANNRQRFFIEAQKGAFNVDQLNALMFFLQETDLPGSLHCLHQLYFQCTSDQYFTLNEEQRAGLEALSGLLIKCWKAERTTRLF